MTIIHDVQQPATRVARYEAPTSLEAALDLIGSGQESVKPVAGGTDLLVELDRGAHEGVDVLLDLSRIPGLAEILVDEQSIHLGPLVTHNQVVASEICRDHALPLAQACLEVGSPQLRNRATVVGNVVTASPANDTISALLALGAIVQVASRSDRRSIDLADFIVGFRATTLQPDELVTGITVPRLSKDEQGIFVKLGLRRAQAISVVHLAATIRVVGGQVSTASMALGSVAPTVVLVPDLSRRLRGRGLGEAMIEEAVRAAVEAASPIEDLRATADYRRSLVETMTRRAIGALVSGEQASFWPRRPPLLWGSDFDGRFPTDRKVATSIAADDEISCTVNGKPATGANANGTTLLDWLRDEVGAKGVKEGCAEGECGACTIDLDGAAVMSCLVPAGRADGATIVTVEGLASAVGLHPIQRAFVETGAVQCGYCTPGFLVSCAKLLEELSTPTADQVVSGLAGNLCRCTGYRAIEAAVEIASRAGGVE